MTRTKKVRLFAESGAPRPGDLVLLEPGHSFRTSPGNKGRILRYSQKNEVALIIGFDKFLEDALLVSLGNNTMGWYDVRDYVPCP